MSVPAQLCVPVRMRDRPRLTMIGSHATGGRLYRCDCGAEVWSYFGFARRHDEAHEQAGRPREVAESSRPRRRKGGPR